MESKLATSSESPPSLKETMPQRPTKSTTTRTPPPSPTRWDTFQPIFFNPALKLTALRIVLLSSFITLALSGIWFPFLFSDKKKDVRLLYLIVLLVTFVHHIMSAFKVFFFIRLLDLLLIIAEIILLAFHSKYFRFDRWSPMSIIGIVIAIWTLVVCLVFLALCRVVAVIRKKGANLIKPFDLLEDSQRLKGLPMKNSPAAASILMGRSIWKTRFPGESNVVRLVRGIFGGIFILVMVIYGIVNIAIYPVRETALTPVKEYRVLGTPIDFQIEDSMWHIAFMRPVDLFPDVNSSDFLNAVELTPLWDGSNADAPDCEIYSMPQPSKINSVNYEVFSARCPPRNNIAGTFSWVQTNLPDLLVKINFTLLGLPDRPATANLWSSAVQVMPGLTSSSDYILRTSTPITMLPSTNNLGELEMEIRQIFKNPALSGLGMFESTNSFASARLKSLLPDPLANSASNDLLTVANNYATLRLFMPDAISDIRIIQDYREKAVLDGFAVIGGLWTFLCAVFAIFFGISMTRIVFDMKPLSVFGMAQQFERDTIVEEYFATYPQIRTEIQYPHRDRGLLTLFRDHLIDVELFQEHIDESEKERVQMERAESEELEVTEDPTTIDPTLRYRM